MAIVAPSLLACNFLELGKVCEMINQSNADWFHLDIMDGIFVPNISFGLPIVEQIKKIATKKLDVHLMIKHPEHYIEKFAQAGADILSIHIETSYHIHRTLQHIKELCMQTGIAINPHTPVELLFDILENVDIVCLMSVNPGFGGQKFIPHSLKKIEKLKQFIVQNKLTTIIEVDGGVDLNNYKQILASGGDALVAGTAIFNTPNPLQVIQTLKNNL